MQVTYLILIIGPSHKNVLIPVRMGLLSVTLMSSTVRSSTNLSIELDISMP
jgi:hypothetical protein